MRGREDCRGVPVKIMEVVAAAMVEPSDDQSTSDFVEPLDIDAATKSEGVEPFDTDTTAKEIVGRLRSLSKSSSHESDSQKGVRAMGYAHKFPWLTASELREYKTYTRTCFDLTAIGPITFFITIYYVAHANFEYALTDGPLFICGLLSGLVASILFYIVFIFAHGARSLSDVGVKNSFMKGLSRIIFHSSNLEDLIAILATMSASSYLYARVLNGQCAPGISLWAAQRCNPVAVSHSIPIDQVIYVYSFPLIHQLILRGVSIQAVFVCWCISTTTIVASVVHAEAYMVSHLHV